MRRAQTLPTRSELPVVAVANEQELQHRNVSDLVEISDGKLLPMTGSAGERLHEYFDSRGFTCTLQLLVRPFATPLDETDLRSSFQRSFDILERTEPEPGDLLRRLVEDGKLLVFILRDAAGPDPTLVTRALTISDRHNLPLGIALPLGAENAPELLASSSGAAFTAAGTYELTTLMRHELEHVLARLSELTTPPESSAEREWMISYWDALFIDRVVRSAPTKPGTDADWTDAKETWQERLAVHQRYGARSQLDGLNAHRVPTPRERSLYSEGCNLFATSPAWLK